VRELEIEYEGRVRFEIVAPEDTAKRAAELQQYDLGSHGLVGLDADGVEKAHVPGHQFGREEILAAIEAVMR
jgi:hypothetical protein